MSSQESLLHDLRTVALGLKTTNDNRKHFGSQSLFWQKIQEPLTQGVNLLKGVGGLRDNDIKVIFSFATQSCCGIRPEHLNSIDCPSPLHLNYWICSVWFIMITTP